MFTVALIGGDGAGKTTIARHVIQHCGMPMKYLYMGLSTRSSNHALPTSRLVLFVKRWLYRKRSPRTHADVPADQLEYSEETHGWLWNTARFVNRLAEAWYRQLLSWAYQLRGQAVIYDRHFYFDTAPGIVNSQSQSLLLLDKLFFQLMTRFYPKPALTIFLDAPPELLFRRKGEASPEYLERQREVFLAQGSRLRHFVRVDAAQPLEAVQAEVLKQVQDFASRHHYGIPAGERRN